MSAANAQYAFLMAMKTLPGHKLKTYKRTAPLIITATTDKGAILTIPIESGSIAQIEIPDDEEETLNLSDEEELYILKEALCARLTEALSDFIEGYVKTSTRAIREGLANAIGENKSKGLTHG